MAFIPVPDSAFALQPESIVGQIISLGQGPVLLTRDGEEQEIDQFVLEVDDMTKRFDPFTYYFKPSGHKRSKWMRWLGRCEEELGISITSSGQLVGNFYRFQFEDMEWKNNDPNTEPMVAEDVPVIAQQFKDRDAAIVCVKDLVGEEVYEDLIADAAEDEKYAAGRDVFRKELVIGAIDGKTHDQMIRELVADEECRNDNAFLSTLVNHSYVDALVNEGRLTVDSDGIYTRS